jgi:hypothetical protein
MAQKKIRTDQLGAGAILQVVRTDYATYANTTSTIPVDDTKPQWNEGATLAGLDTTITPKSATSYLLVVCDLNIRNDTNTDNCIALFRDPAGTDVCKVAKAGGGQYMLLSFNLTLYVASGSTAATIFKIRWGCASGTIQINGASGARYYGGAVISSMTIYEIQA